MLTEWALAEALLADGDEQGGGHDLASARRRLLGDAVWREGRVSSGAPLGCAVTKSSEPGEEWAGPNEDSAHWRLM